MRCPEDLLDWNLGGWSVTPDAVGAGIGVRFQRRTPKTLKTPKTRKGQRQLLLHSLASRRTDLFAANPARSSSGIRLIRPIRPILPPLVVDASLGAPEP